MPVAMISAATSYLHRDVAVARSYVELRGTTRARAGSAGPSVELHVQEAGLHEPIQVERRERPPHPGAAGSGVAVHRSAGASDDLVQPSAHRLRERGDRVESCSSGRCPCVHAAKSKPSLR